MNGHEDNYQVLYISMSIKEFHSHTKHCEDKDRELGRERGEKRERERERGHGRGKLVNHRNITALE